ncbi:DNA-3-methyladenine glycosylase 2 family protein [Alcaligenaceae bacterium A4P071]|nr:DNA-3-methyladenine glycosylase 2 family protein [Alcaligenaceae bacterium B3P038]MDQ2147489.1 DNA-3-methyladenine glycosylase 2 family protein [Alcaligenaceae bacterium C4P045]MDQ2184822.1 DNA-3-methyladenine glycosylase 2 family protein [Alcaligenaceae bacterium A4P071]
MSIAETASIKPAYWDEAVADLTERDRILKKIIPQHPEAWLGESTTPFITLARAIIGQQITVKAADGLWVRFQDLAGKRPSPASVLKTTVPGLRENGLSLRKAEYLIDLATHFAEKRVHPDRWSEMEDEQVIAELVAIRGIGRWTAEMFLIFNLQRPDVLPLDDLGLLKAISLHYFSGEPVSRFEAREVSNAWQPWRTVATWYLWRSLDAVAVQY